MLPCPLCARVLLWLRRRLGRQRLPGVATALCAWAPVIVVQTVHEFCI